MAILRKVRCRWASVIEPNTKFEPRWEIEAELNTEQAAMFADLGVKVKDDKDAGVQLVRFKRKVEGTTKKGVKYSLQAPKVVDGNKEPFTALIGNGSLVNIAYTIRAWEGFGGEGVAADLNAVQVLELVEFGGDQGSDEFDAEGDTTTIEDNSKEEEDIF